ncbi:hypothetical protein [Rhizobium tumorigenes]|uniref:Uncharacterized protein n=1 Tax=Rhizobium tumorigenes TaxID=2041385 RepID=A0AAF1KSL6_9HYPH|nr:hypothetical protein [Rhizobium tumorigenes]WFR97703.1 hypothetical protein PR017_21215 [Rhizobium tumorigenes]
MEFWSAVVVLAYFLAGVTRINNDMRSGRLGEPGSDRNRTTGIAVVGVFIWPLYRRLAGIVFSMIIAILVTALLMWCVSVFAGLVWQITIVAVIYGLLLLSNLATIRG